MLKEFKEFAMRGNVLDLAIGIVIGAAFGAIITSFVNDILLPPIGLLLGGLQFDNMFWTIKGVSYPTLALAQENGAVTINYGLFISAVINFLIVAFAIFLVIRLINKMKREPASASRTGNQRVALLRLHHIDQGYTLPELHVTVINYHHIQRRVSFIPGTDYNNSLFYFAIDKIISNLMTGGGDVRN